jgi:hypothetical protein
VQGETRDVRSVAAVEQGKRVPIAAGDSPDQLIVGQVFESHQLWFWTATPGIQVGPP